jgi:hypothetical protein
MNSDLLPYRPHHGADVGVSPGFPEGARFFGNPSDPTPAVGTCSRYRPPERAWRRLLRSLCPFVVAVGPRYPPEPLERRWPLRPRPTRLIPVLGQAPKSAWACFVLRWVLARVRLPTRSNLLPVAARRTRTDPGFLPASRIEDQSLPWGRRISLFTSGAGDWLKAAPSVGHQVVRGELSRPYLSSPDGYAASFERTDRTSTS